MLRGKHHKVVEELRARILELEAELSSKGGEMVQEKQLNQQLEKQKAEMMANFEEIDGRNKTLEEKFQKLKQVYTKLREEHVSLIRKVKSIKFLSFQISLIISLFCRKLKLTSN